MSEPAIYRQWAHMLRIAQPPGTPDRMSIRPRAGSRQHGWREFLDGDADPTLVSFAPHERVDVGLLLASGAIEVYEVAEEGDDG